MMKNKLAVSYRCSIAEDDTNLFWADFLVDLNCLNEKLHTITFQPGKLISDQVTDFDLLISLQKEIKEIRDAFSDLYCYEFPEGLNNTDHSFIQFSATEIKTLLEKINRVISAILLERPELENKFEGIKLDYYNFWEDVSYKRKSINKYLPGESQSPLYKGTIELKSCSYDFIEQKINSKTKMYPDDFTVGWFDELKGVKKRLQTSKYLKGCILEKLGDEDYRGLLVCAKNNSSNSLSFKITPKKSPINQVCDNLSEISKWILHENVLKTPTYYEKVLFTILYEKL